MAPRSIFANLLRGDDGTFSTAYGSFMLKSAMQPIFRSNPQTGLEIEAFEGLVRIFRDDVPMAPGGFFSLVAPADMSDIDSILRSAASRDQQQAVLISVPQWCTAGLGRVAGKGSVSIVSGHATPAFSGVLAIPDFSSRRQLKKLFLANFR